MKQIHGSFLQGFGVAELRPITLADRPLFDAAFARLRQPISDSSFAACYLWAETLAFSWTVIEEHLCVFSLAGGDCCLILPPMALSLAAENRVGPCLATCFAIMDARNGPGAGGTRSRIEYVSDELLDKLRLSGAPALSAEPMDADYVYPVRAMIDLDGGLLKNKRKLRNGFVREWPGAITDKLRPEHVGACLALVEKWRRRADEAREGETNDRFVGASDLRDHDEACTRAAILECDALRLESMTLWGPGPASPRLLGFTLGERLGPKAAVVHVEKVDPDVRGGSQFIYSEFCRQRFGDCETVNAGDDWGLPTLRFTKMSYRPTKLLAKSVLTRESAGRVAPVDREALRVIAAPTRPHAAPTGLAASARAAFRIRLATSEDARAILALESSAFARAQERFNIRQARGLIANPRAVALVAESEGEAIGWAVCLTRRTRRDPAGRLYAIAVAPGRASRGVGRALAEAALAALRDRGVERVYLEVREDNAPAIGLYRSLGFERVASLPNYYGSGRNGMRMRLATTSSHNK